MRTTFSNIQVMEKKRLAGKSDIRATKTKK